MIKFLKRKPHHIRFGNWGEKKAREFFKKKGCHILFNNFRCKEGEIDFICINGKILYFVEVKTRTDNKYSRPIDGLSYEQINRIKRASKKYLREIEATNCQYKYQLVEIVKKKWDISELRISNF